jgi:peptide deformylase
MKHMLYQVIDRAGFTVEEVLQHNIDKLDGKRYKDGYSDAAAQERADKEGEE